VCKVIASKVLTARVGTIKKAEELVLVLVEQEQGAVVVEALISGFAHKVPKAVAAAVNMALSVYTEFGAKAVKPQPMLKALPGLFDSKDAKTRDAAKNLTVVLGHWVGRELVETALVEKMRDAMKKDVAELLSDLPAEKPKAARLTRKEAAKKAAAAAAKQVAVAPTEGEEGVDAAAGGVPTAVAVAVDDDDENDGAVDSYEFAEPQDICREIKAAFYTGLESKKWQERKGALVSLKELARTPRIAPGEFSDVNTGLRKIISKDSNVVCVAEAVQCAGLLAKGLRPGYRNAALQFVPLLLDKFKDKNTNLVNACHGSLGYMATHCVSLGDIMDDLQTALKHANPKVKQETLKFIHVTLLAMDAAHSKKLHKPLLPLLVKGAGEATPALREAAMGCIAEMAAKAGSLAPFESAIDKLDDAKKAKLISMAQAAISGEPLTAAPPSPTVGASPKGASRPSSGRPSTAASRTPAAVARPATAKPSKSAAPAKEEKETEDPVALSSAALTGDEAIVKFAEVAGDGTITELKSTNWKQRLDAMVELLERMQGDTAGKADALVFGVAALPGWGEKNFQVMGKCFEVGRMCAEDPSSGYGKVSRTPPFLLLKRKL
jgi:cytoskeleton-associated protein 5